MEVQTTYLDEPAKRKLLNRLSRVEGQVPYMKKRTLLLAALFAVSLYAECLPGAGAQEEAKPANAGKQDPQEKARADAVTFHVIGMKKTASGAT